MKNSFVLFSFFLVAGFGNVYSQECPKIQFTYDSNGERIQRELVVVACGGGDARQTKPETPSFPIAVYPNPSLDKINIGIPADSTENTSMVQLFDLAGKEVYSTNTSALQMEMDVSKYPAGT